MTRLPAGASVIESDVLEKLPGQNLDVYVVWLRQPAVVAFEGVPQ